MYHPVSVTDSEWKSADMEERESIYLDTISLASDYPASAAAAANRKSLSMSRQTIYHSAEDVANFANEQINTKDKSIGIGSILGKYSNRFLGAERGNGDCSGSGGGSGGNAGNGGDRSTIDTADGKNDETWKYFQDGVRTVDYVLAYLGDDPHPRNAEKRAAFEANLENEGLELEREQTQRIHFVKIHASRDVLRRYCEILKIKMPIRKISEQDGIIEEEFQLMQQIKSFFGRPFQFVKLNAKHFPERDYRLLYDYSKNRSYLFDDDNSPTFFTQSTRITVVHFILERQRFSHDDESSNNVGIEKLLNERVYHAAYPLHDGDCNLPGSERHLLYTEWAAVNKWIKHQPLDNIKEYFGVKIALYFAWLGFYTHMLIPAALVGLVCFLYGLITLFSNTVSEDVCSPNNTIIMCPQCDEQCDYWHLSDTCIYSRIAHLFDNNMTVAFACFMSFWAVLYLELWKRYSARLIHRWGMTDFTHQAEHPRPQYLARLKTAQKKKFNVIHRVLEPHVPYWKAKFPIYLFSFSVVFLLICVAIIAVFGITIYRMSLIYTRNLYGGQSTIQYQATILPATAAILNLFVITVLNYAYDYLAVYLTDLEYRRTQTEYDESLTLKIYLFQFINYYSSIFYIAFLKGKFVGYPAKYNRIYQLRQEECSPGGCLMELCIQLVIIMVGKQALNALLEMLIPYLMKKIRSGWNKIGQPEEHEGQSLISCNQWTNDYKLLPWSARGLFDEYLEMIIQYGFVTLFVVAFPLAPLFALINNIFEMRLDAKKFLRYYRRPVPTRVQDIGVWFNIMAILGRLSIASSAFIIAFSSNFIPRLVYMISINSNHTDIGYLNYTLAYFNTTDFQAGTAPLNSTFSDVEICRYPEYRNPPWSDRPYKRPLVYWQILAARLVFLVVFQNVVGFIQMCIAWLIPDVPGKLNDQIKREQYLTREIIIKRESLRNGGGGGGDGYITSYNVVGNAAPPSVDGMNNNSRRRKVNGDIESTIL